MTDGLANNGMTDPDELARHAAELRARGVSATTFGIGADFDEVLLQSLADAGGGHFYFIADAAADPGPPHERGRRDPRGRRPRRRARDRAPGTSSDRGDLARTRHRAAAPGPSSRSVTSVGAGRRGRRSG